MSRPSPMRRLRDAGNWLALALLLGACGTIVTTGETRSAPDAEEIVRTATSVAVASATDATAPPGHAVEPATPTPRPTATVTSTPSPTPIPSPTHAPSATPTATPIGPCANRAPADDLLTIVSLDYGLSRDYEPTDLVALSDYFGNDVTLGFPTMLRAVVVEPLARLITDMEAEGLAPVIRSGYRSYAQQVTAREKWIRQYPDRVNILSAPPGHSEHQLGTTVDFGSPELAELVDDPDIEFHTYFYLTSEGQWLAANAHRYGFTLSYPRQGQGLTGFFYEPWHYRYVGIELATLLAEQGRYLLEYQLASDPPPCVP